MLKNPARRRSMFWTNIWLVAALTNPKQCVVYPNKTYSRNSVTRRLNFAFNFWPFTAMNNCPTALKFTQEVHNFATYKINCQKIAKGLWYFDKVAKYRQIWSPEYRNNLNLGCRLNKLNKMGHPWHLFFLFFVFSSNHRNFRQINEKNYSPSIQQGLNSQPLN